MHIGDRLRELRQLVPSLTARELDRIAGRTEGHAALIEARDARALRTDVVVSYATALGASLDWLVLGEGKRPSAAAVARAVESARRSAAA